MTTSNFIRGDHMIELIKPMAEWGVIIIEGTGIFIIVFFALYSLFSGMVRFVRRDNAEQIFDQIRQRLGKGILLGLEFLVAADIIHTVAVELSFETVGVLAIIVLIRTFLSFTLEVELSGQWPWQKAK